MKTTLTLLALAVNLSVFSQGIQFIEARTDSDIAIINMRADSMKKPIFIDCYTEWCGPCKYMEKNIFTNDTVAKFYNEHFICARMDMEKGVGISRTYKYEVYAYPTFIFIDRGIVHRATGAKDVKGMIELGETALNPEKRFSHWQNEYNAGNRQPEFIRGYLKQLNTAGMETKEVVDWYFISLPKESLLSKENFEMIDMFIGNYNDSIFDFLLANREKYITLAGKEKVEDKIFNVFKWAQIYKTIADSANPSVMHDVFDEDAYNKVVSKINKVDFQRKEEVLCNYNIWYCYEKKEWKKYTEFAKKYLDNYAKNNWNEYNNFAWAFYENKEINDEKSLHLAIGWAKKSMEIENHYFNNDTYTALLFKLGKKKDALKAAENAIALGKKQGQDTTPTEELLEKIKKMK